MTAWERRCALGHDTGRCERRQGESLAAYRQRCDIAPDAMDAELWGTMDQAERRAYLRDVAREAALTERQERQLIASAIDGTFTTLVTALRSNQAIRIEEIRAGRDVEIARITGRAVGEREYLDGTRPPSNAPPVPQSSGLGGSTGAIIGLGLLAKLAGLF